MFISKNFKILKIFISKNFKILKIFISKNIKKFTILNFTNIYFQKLKEYKILNILKSLKF